MENCDRVSNPMSRVDVERLHQFFGAYFHEDWDLEAPDWDGLVKRFVKDHPEAKTIAELSDLIDRYASQHDDEALGHLMLRELGCYYWPAADGLTTREWMHRVAAFLRTCAVA